AVADSTRFSRSMMRRLASVSCSATVSTLHDFAKNALDVIGGGADGGRVTAQLSLVSERVRAGSRNELEREGRLLTKVGSRTVVVFGPDGRPWALEDRCPHMGFPLHQGTVERGLLTCHWHHARFDLASGCTLDPWADDTPAFEVAVEDDDVWVWTRVVTD